MASSIEHTVTRNLQCPVCLELLSDPKQLSCTHTFCKKCLSSILACSSQTTANTIQCPICRAITHVRKGNVENLDTNVPIKSLVDDVRNSQQLCDMCDFKSKAVHFCSECGKYLCDTCLEKHNTWPPNLKHRVVSVEDIRKGKVVLEKEVYCPEHQSERRRRICTDVCVTCKMLICERCRMFNHWMKGHIVQSVEEYNASTKAEIESLQARGKTKSTTIKNYKTCIASQKRRITDHVDCKKAEINQIYQESLKKLNKRKSTLDKQLETKRVELCKTLDEMREDNERLVTSIESASVLVGNSLKAPLDGDTIVIRDSLSDELKTVLGREDPKKKLASDVADRAEQLVFTPNNQRDELNIGEVQFVKYELECDVALAKKNSMGGMAPTPDGRMAVGCSNPGGIKMFSADGQLQQTVLNDVNSKNIGFLTDGRYVVRHGLNTITLYTNEWEKLDLRFDTLSHDEGGTSNLTVDSNDLIYLSYNKAKKIHVFSPAGGKAIREIPCNGYEPYQIISYNDLLITKDSNSIRVIDKEGNVKHKVDVTVVYPWVYPFAAVTQNNSILIAGVNHDDRLVSIDEYTNELKHIKNIVSDQKIEKPERAWYYLRVFKSGEIAFCTTDRLYIFKLTITPTNV